MAINETKETKETKEMLECDCLIVGAGPAGLAAAIRLKQLQPQWTVCVLEKAAEVGGHSLSGAVMDPKALLELWPEALSDAEIQNILTPVQSDSFMFLTEKQAFNLPVPRQMRNEGNYIVSLGKLCRVLAREAEKLGVEVYAGFVASQLFFTEKNEVAGVITGDKGVDKNHQPTERYQPGIILKSRYTLLAEGCRGYLSEQVISRYDLSPHRAQTYALGVKELWQVSPAQHQPGKIIHTIGWPLDHKTYGGAFIYHLQDSHKVATGFVVGLDYQNPTLDIFEELQRFKLHPSMRPLLTDAKRIAYGARSLVEGGLQSLPKLDFPGGLLLGDSAGFLNVPRIKGIHLALKSGMLAAHAVSENCPENYCQNVKQSWAGEELYLARNIRPAFRWGLFPGLVHAAIDTYIFRNRAPWTLSGTTPATADHQKLWQARRAKKIMYPRPDHKITFDKLSSLYLANISHAENQPTHLHLVNTTVEKNVNIRQYGAPEQYYCPALVYEIVKDTQGAESLQINAQNCLHCKACDIKDPLQNIRWTPPEGGSGPHYGEL